MTATILAIDDDDDLRELLTILLEQEGYDVETARDGLDGLSHVARRMPDLILLDMKMPTMSGPQFAAEYRARYAGERRAPIVVMTAGENAPARCEEMGANDYVPKPFTADDLVRVIKRHQPARPAP